jgi:hypothetical protein
MDLDRRRALVERYREGPSVVEAALAGATDAELDTRPRLIAEDEPEIIGYDGNVFAQRLYYGDRPVGAALAAISAARAVTAEILDRLTEAEWQRKGRHNEHPTYGVLEWLEIYAEHCHEHADQIKAALAEARQTAAGSQQ